MACKIYNGNLLVISIIYIYYLQDIPATAPPRV